MRILITTLLLTATPLLGCGEPEHDHDSPMAGMSVEEHATMQAGPAQGELDSSDHDMHGHVHPTPNQERALGVVYATVSRETLTRRIRTVGLVEAAEQNIADVTPKIEGFVEELFVATTGEGVRMGQPLLTLYSPALVAAQEELLIAKRLADQLRDAGEESSRNAVSMLEAARRRLGYWDITDEQIDAVEASGEVTKTLTLTSPVSGIVLDKNVVLGQRLTQNSRIYRLVDLSEVWIEAELYERDMQFVGIGSRVHIEMAAYPGEHLEGTVSFVYPTVDEPTRTNRVRVSVPNRDRRLKPGMFATAFFDVTVGEDVLAIPSQAVIATGERDLVFIRDSMAMLIPREVTVGGRAGNLVQVLDGLAEGETVVASAAFLIDAESKLGSGAMAGMDHSHHD
jgi:Cu(I)/Ag(I) efflux system membrane fusion protein